MADSHRPPGISIIEQMAAEHHQKGPSVLPWDRLSKADRTRLIGQMEAAVRTIPDKILLKCRGVASIIDTGEGRDALLADHRQAKRSVLYGQYPRPP